MSSREVCPKRLFGRRRPVTSRALSCGKANWSAQKLSFRRACVQLSDDPQVALVRVNCLRNGSEVALERGDVREGVARVEAAQQF